MNPSLHFLLAPLFPRLSGVLNVMVGSLGSQFLATGHAPAWTGTSWPPQTGKLARHFLGNVGQWSLWPSQPSQDHAGYFPSLLLSIRPSPCPHPIYNRWQKGRVKRPFARHLLERPHLTAFHFSKMSSKWAPKHKYPEDKFSRSSQVGDYGSLLFYRELTELLAVTAHLFNPTTREAEERGSWQYIFLKICLTLKETLLLDPATKLILHLEIM